MPRDLAEIQVKLVRENLIDIQSSIVSGVAAKAGADDLRLSPSIWAKGIFGMASQKSSKNNSDSYDASSFGVNIGTEFSLGDNIKLGAYGTYKKTTLKYKAVRDGDKDVFDSIFGSVYGNAIFKNNFVLGGIVSVGNSTIDPTTYDPIAKKSNSDTKLSAFAYNASIIGGYKIEAQSFSVTPLAGFSFGSYHNPTTKVGYGLASTNAWNKTHFDLVGGISASTDIYSSSTIISPELHGFVYYNLKGNKQKRNINIQNGGNNLISYSSSDINKTNFILGASINIKSSMVEYGASLDTQLAEKYLGILGSVKLKINL